MDNQNQLPFKTKAREAVAAAMQQLLNDDPDYEDFEMPGDWVLVFSIDRLEPALDEDGYPKSFYYILDRDGQHTHTALGLLHQAVNMVQDG